MSMEIIRIFWIIIFFFFALILIFIWSKMTVISNKIKAIMKLTTDIDAIISGKPASPGQQPTEEGEAVNEEASAG